MDALTNTARKYLIKLVESDKLTIKNAANLLKMNYSTAKAIIKKYRLYGSFSRENKISKRRRNIIKIKEREQLLKNLKS